MRIIIKYILKNLWEKKLRTLLILFSVMAACGLFFSSSTIGDTFAQLYINRIQVYYGQTDIIIQPDERSPSQWIKPDSIKNMENIKLAAGRFESGATYRIGAYEKASLILMGSDWEVNQQINPVQVLSESGLIPFSGMKIVLPKEFCKKYGFHAGDSINLTINGELRKLVIAAVATGGIFTEDGSTVFGMLPADTLSALHNARGAFTSVQVCLKDESRVTETLSQLQEIYKGYQVQQPFNGEDIKQEMESITMPFMLMTFIVAFMSMFIIFTSFRVITMERLPVVGTFRSIGATRRTTDNIMLVESLLYGIIGSGLGLGLGLIILKGMSETLKDPWIKDIETRAVYTPFQMGLSFAFGVFLCFASSLIPILKVSRIPLKDIILNTMDKAVKKNGIRLVLGILFIVISVYLPSRLPKSIAMPGNIICMLLSICSIVLLVPYVTALFVAILEKLYVILLGNVGVLAAKNLRENRSILNNISLLSIGIASLMMINLISYSVGVEVVGFYNKACYDITYASDACNAHMERLLQKIDGVSEVYGLYELSSVEVLGQSTRISTFMGIDYRKFFEYWDFTVQQDSMDKLPELEQERAVFLTQVLKDRYDLKTGDQVTFRINNRDCVYTVAGFFNSLYNNGSLALISDKYFRLDTGQQEYSAIYIKTNEAAEVVAERIEKEMSHYYPWLETMEEMKKSNQESNEQMFTLLKGFSLLAMLIGIIGVVNNLLISFIQRRRQLAIFRSIGMEKGQSVRMILIEAFTGGLIGGTSGVLAGLLLMYIVQYFIVSIELPIDMHYPLDIIMACGVAGLAIMVAASVGPSVKSSRLNIIEAIKYE